MAKAVLPLKGTSWVEAKLAGSRSWNSQPTKALTDLSAHKRTFRSQKILKDAMLLPEAERISSRMELAALEAINGSPAEVVREIYHRAASAWVPVVEAIDFTPQVFEDPGWGSIADANETIKLYGGEIIEKKGPYARCRWRAIPQPFAIEMPKVFMAAALSGDRVLAKRLASAYPLHGPHQITVRFEIREAILRHLLAEDELQAKALAARLEDGYPVDFPPERIEFPLAAVNRDAESLVAGMKAVNTRFISRWDEKTYRKRLEKFNVRRRVPELWETFADRVRQELVGLKWAISTWALAFCNIAAWRGVTLLAEQRKHFSPWIREDLSGL